MQFVFTVWQFEGFRNCFLIYLFTHLFKVDNDKKDTVYKNTNKIGWG